MITLSRFWITLTPDSAGADVKFNFPPEGVPLAATVTVTLAWEEVAFAPAQVSEYAVVLVGDTTKVPVVACAPVHPPEAVHEVALVDDQLKIELPPAGMLLAVSDKVTVGVGTAATVTVAETRAEVPLVPAQVSE
jgi:hypothetical protein